MPFNRAEHEWLAAQVQRQLDEETFRLAWAEGWTISLTDAVRDALAVRKTPTPG